MLSCVVMSGICKTHFLNLVKLVLTLPEPLTLLYTCLTHINPNTITSQSVAVQSFFEEFVDALRNKRGFDYDNTDDWDWLNNVACGSQYVTEVIRTYIDKDFTPPCKK